MSNPYFEFKQFKIYHDCCAMKVGTDGVLLGAWADVSGVRSILDVGTGSGLIAMMLAQRCAVDTRIDAIDIDYDAVMQAQDNFKRAYHTQIKAQQTTLQAYTAISDRRYDLIVSNPPFFSSSLVSPDNKRTLARHADTLTAEELLVCSSKLLTTDGCLSFIYPHSLKSTLVTLAEKNELYLARITNVLPTPTALPKRVLITLSRKDTKLIEDDLIIELQRHIYSLRFRELLKDYYLKF